ncbi:MAG: hypothetical protein WBS33_00800 [Verrucomicrobiia bacterium]
MKIKTRIGLYGLVGAFALTGIVGCSRSDTVAEGVIYSVEYQLPGGGTEGFTRVNNFRCVPAGGGSWNVDARGKLTHDFVFITRQQQPTEIIPVSRLVSIQFGDGGIAQVDKQTNPGK